MADPTRLKRQLRTGDAVVIGLGAMIGAGIFAAVGPAAHAAGAGLLLGLVIAGVLASLNAASVAQLAAVHPESGGAYAYGRARLGPFWGFLAGFAFVVGKLASCAAMALTFAHYASPAHARALAIGAVVVVTVVNYLGVQKTVWATRVIVVVVLAALALTVTAAASSDVDVTRLDVSSGGWRGTLEAAGLLFFAFAGYARIATLAEEVVDPARTIPRAMAISLAVTLVIYAVVMATAIAAVGAPALATSSAPLATAVEAGRFAWAAPVVRVGAAVASLGVLLSLLAGIGRTAFAMASNGDLPRPLAAVHPRFLVPHRAELAGGAIVAAIVLLVDVRGAIGFSSFGVLAYYAIANASAWKLGPDERRAPRALAVLGVLGCVVVAATLPLPSVIAGASVLAIGAMLYAVRASVRKRAPPTQ